MKEKTCKTVRLYYGLATSLISVVVGALLIWQTLDIYLNGGRRPFSREIVGQRLALVSPAFWIWLVMIVAGFVIWEVFPVKKKIASLKDDCYALKRLKKRIPPKVGERELDSLGYVMKEEETLLLLKLCVFLVCLAGAVYGIVYLATPAHFPKTDVTAEIVRMVKNILPCAAIAFVAAIAFKYAEIRSAKKQLPHVKKLAASKGGDYIASVKYAGADTYFDIGRVLNNKYFILGVRIAVGCLAIGFIIAGAVNGNMRAIFIKAVNICTECIGLG